VVTVPDHWHVLIGIAAARAGKQMLESSKSWR